MNCKKKLKEARRLLLEDYEMSQGEISGKIGLKRKELLKILIELCDEELYQFGNPLKKNNAKMNDKMIVKVRNYCDSLTKILQNDNYNVKNKAVVGSSLRLIEDIVTSFEKKQPPSDDRQFDYGNVIDKLIFEINSIAMFKMVYQKHQKEFDCYLHKPENYCEILEKFFDCIRDEYDEEYLLNVAKILGFVANEANSKQLDQLIDTYNSQLKAKKNNRGCRKAIKKYLGIIKKSICRQAPVDPAMLQYLGDYYGVRREFNNNLADSMLEKDADYYHDLTARHVITIDGTKMGCLEDAISIEKMPNGNYLFGLYIIDPYAYIKENSPLEQEAAIRTQSIYARGSVIQMFPEELAYNYLSLYAKKPRKVIANEYEFSPEFDLVSFNSRKALIKVNKNYDFNEMNNIKSKQMEALVKQLHYLRDNLKKEYSVINNSSNHNFFGDELINCIKLFGNHTMAEKYSHTNMPFLYCVDDGINPVVNDLQNNNPFLRLESEIKKSKTYYATEKSPHQSLRLNCYARVTTPMRNYAALKNQKLYRQVLIEGHEFADEEIYSLEEELANIADYMNRKQETIQAFTEESEYYYQKVKKLES